MHIRTRPLIKLTSFVSTLATVAALVAACSTDPLARSRKFIESGDRYVQQNKYAEAVIEYRNAVQANQTSGEARKKLASAYARTGDATRAFEEYVRAADLLPTDVDLQLTAGRYLLSARKFQDALARGDAIIKQDPSNVKAQLLRGNALANLNAFDDAIKAIEEAVRLNPTEGSTFANLGLVQLAKGQRDAAETAFKKAVELSPKSIEVHLALGNFYWSVGRRDETEAAFRGALALEADNGLANRAMASLMIATGRYREAEPYLVQLADRSKDVNAVMTLADYYAAAGRPRDAIARLEAIGKGGGATGTARLALAYASAGDTAKAKTLVDQVLQNNPNAVDAQLLKSKLLLQEGKGDEALSTVRAAVSANPSSAQAQFALGRLYASRGDFPSAETAFREVLKLNPRASIAQLEIARLQLASGKAAESVRTADEAVKSSGRNIAARLTLVRSLLSSKDVGRAERELAALRAEDPQNPDVLVQASYLALLRNDVAGARRELDRAQQLAPDSLDVLAAQITSDFKAADVAAAKARIERRLAQGSNPGLLLLAARTYLTAKDTAAAESALRKAIEADPSNLQPYAMLGQLYLSQKKLDQARGELEALASKQVRPVGALTMIGMIHQAQGNQPLAKKRYEEALGLDPRAAVAANNLAWMYADAGQNLDVALGFAQTAVEVAPESPEVLDTLGWVYYKKGLSQLAIPPFQRCVEKAPKMAECHYHLGLAYLHAGETERGKAALNRSLASGASSAISEDIRKRLASQ